MILRRSRADVHDRTSPAGREAKRVDGGGTSAIGALAVFVVPPEDNAGYCSALGMLSEELAARCKVRWFEDGIVVEELDEIGTVFREEEVMRAGESDVCIDAMEGDGESICTCAFNRASDGAGFVGSRGVVEDVEVPVAVGLLLERTEEMRKVAAAVVAGELEGERRNWKW